MMDVIYAIGIVVFVLAAWLIVDQIRHYGRRANVNYTLGKPPDVPPTEGFLEALKKIHRASCYGKPRR